jgi:colanic acid/amylovoran biosynthesis protein
MYSKHFLAWTQSYGPFSNALIRFLARKDLGALPVIMCRGESGRAVVEKLLPGRETGSFPDVAITLDYDAKLGRAIIDAMSVSEKPLITVSPSAVLYSKSVDPGGINLHVSDMIWLCDYLESTGFSVLLVPHTFRVENHDPVICDYAVCAEVYERCKSSHKNIFLLEGDRPATELKSVIANAEMHIGARYHSLVAALSSGVPAIALSWHMKYQDILTQYGMSEYVVPLCHGDEFKGIVKSLYKKLADERETMIAGLVSRQEQLLAEVDRNRIEFMDSYNHLKNEV